MILGHRDGQVWRLLTGLASATLAIIAFGSRAPAQQQGAPPSAPVARIEVALPQPMTLGDADLWIRILKPTGDNAERVRSLVAEFVTREAAEYPRFFGPTLELAESIPASGGLYSTPENLESFRILLRERQRGVNRFGSLEEELFAAIAAELGETAGPALSDAIRQVRRRTRFCAFRCDLPMADLDLRQVVLAFDAVGGLEVVEHDAWVAAWPSYDQELASLEEQRVTRRLKAVLDDAESYHLFSTDLQAFVDDRNGRLSRRLQVERAIISANRRWTACLSEMLSPESGARFREAVDATLYPDLYPNPLDLRPVLNGLPPLTESNRMILKEVHEATEFEIARLAAKESRLEATIMDLAVMESRSIVSHEAREALKQDLEALRLERCEAGKRVLNAARLILELKENPAIEGLQRACSQCR